MGDLRLLNHAGCPEIKSDDDCLFLPIQSLLRVNQMRPQRSFPSRREFYKLREVFAMKVNLIDGNSVPFFVKLRGTGMVDQRPSNNGRDPRVTIRTFDCGVLQVLERSRPIRTVFCG